MATKGSEIQLEAVVTEAPKFSPLSRTIAEFYSENVENNEVDGEEQIKKKIKKKSRTCCYDPTYDYDPCEDCLLCCIVCPSNDDGSGCCGDATCCSCDDCDGCCDGCEGCCDGCDGDCGGCDGDCGDGGGCDGCDCGD